MREEDKMLTQEDERQISMSEEKGKEYFNKVAIFLSLLHLFCPVIDLVFVIFHF